MALNVLVTQTAGGVYSMPSRWQAVLTAMGHTVNIQPISVLDNNSFFSSTNVLIVSDGTAGYSSTQINTIKAFLQSGKPVYLQTEYLSAYGGNTAFAQIVGALGSSFTWGASQNDDQNPVINGSFATTNNAVPSLPYFWYGCTGTAGANIFTFVRSTPGNVPLGWCFCPANTSYGKLITTSDQDWIQNATTYPAAVDLMENIFTHLITPGLCGPSFSASITAHTDVSCNGGSNGSATVTVSGGNPPYTYFWFPSGGSSASIAGQPAGTYTCTVTDASSQTTTAIVAIGQPAALSATSTQKATCAPLSSGSATVTVSGGTAPYTYSWIPSGGNAATATGLGAGTYTCTYTDSKGCFNSRSFTIAQAPALDLTMSHTDVSCGGTGNGTATVTVTGGLGAYTYTWSPSGGNAATASGLATGTYSVICHDANSCIDTQTVTIGQEPAPVPVVSLTHPTTCLGTDGTIVLTGMTASAAYTVTYNKNSVPQAALNLTATTGGVLTLPGLGAGSYSNIAAARGTCISNVPGSFVLNDPAAPATPVAGSNGPICSGTNLALSTATVSGASYSWTGPNGFSSALQNPTIAAATTAASGTYQVTVTVAGCPSAPGSTTALVNPTLIPSVTIAANPSGNICAGTNVTFTATPVNGGSAAYQWLKNGLVTGTSSPTYSDNALNHNDVVSVKLISDALCRSVDTAVSNSITMSVTPYPTLTITPDTQTICSGATTSLALSAPQAGATYSWTVVQSGVSGAASGNGSTIAQALTNSGTATGIAVYTVTPAIGACAGNTATATVKVNPRPVATATPAATNLCSGATANIALSANLTGTTYSWTVASSSVSGAIAGNGSAISQVLTNTGTAPGTATYTITPTTNGCPGTPVTVTITVTPLPVLTVTPTTVSLCSGTATNIALSAPQTGTTYSWGIMQSGATGAAAGSGNTIAQTLTATGTTAGTVTYMIRPSTGSCNGASVNATVTVKPAPALTVTPASQAVCSGAATSLVNSDNLTGTTYAWTVTQSGASGATAGAGATIAQTLTNTSTTPGTATYTITPTTNGCAGTPVSVTVAVNPKPAAVATPANQTLCSGGATGIALSSPVAGATLSWTAAQSGVSGAATGSGSSIAQTLTATGPVTGTATYTVTASANSCAGSSITVPITVNAIPAVPGTLTGPDAPCTGSTQTYSIASVAGASSYTWALPPGWTGTSTTNTINVVVGSSNGNISVQSVNTCGSSVAMTKAVTATPMLTPTISISNNAPALLCSGTQVTYTASVTGGGNLPAYQWQVNGSNTGSNSAVFVYAPEDEDTITCTLTSNYPCLNSNNIVSNAMIMDVTPTVDPSLNIYVPENHICSGIPVTFTATPTHGGTTPAYQWKLNGSNVGANTTTYTYTPGDGDIVRCVMTSNAICASATTIHSNEVPMSVVTVTHPSLAIIANPGVQLTNGQPVTFTAQLNDIGDQGYQVLWYRNNTFTGISGLTWTAVAGTDIKNNNQVKAFLRSFSSCADPDTAWSSNTLTLMIGTSGIGNTGMPAGFKVFPNPAQDKVYFEGLRKGAYVSLCDLSGRILRARTIVQDSDAWMDLSGFAQGVYLLHFNDGKQGHWQVKITKK